jgi:hypothetical protein
VLDTFKPQFVPPPSMIVLLAPSRPMTRNVFVDDESDRFVFADPV